MVQGLTPNLPREVTVDLSNKIDGTRCVEIGVLLNNEESNLYDLCHPRLFGIIKKVNQTWSVSFSIDFLLLEDRLGDPILEAETQLFTRTQFGSEKSLVDRLSNIYSGYYGKLTDYNFKSDKDIFKQIRKHFDDELSELKFLDSDLCIKLIINQKC